MSECVALGKPLFALHAADDREQRLNVGMLRSHGLGMGCAFEAFDPKVLEDWLQGLGSPNDGVDSLQHLPTAAFDQTLVNLTAELLKERTKKP
jgi:hypothetical protein